MDWKSILAASVVRKYVLPIVLGALVTWLVANNHPDFADAICSASAGFDIEVEKCK